MMELITAVLISTAYFLRKPIPKYKKALNKPKSSKSKKALKVNLTQTREAVEILILTLSSGMTIPRSVQVASNYSNSPLIQKLQIAFKNHSLGANLETELKGISDLDKYWKLVTVQLQLSWEQGARILDNLSELDEFLIDLERSQILKKVKSAAVKSVIPLGLCFLPAFMLVVVVPLIAGLIKF